MHEPALLPARLRLPHSVPRKSRSLRAYPLMISSSTGMAYNMFTKRLHRYMYVSLCHRGCVAAFSHG